MAESAGRHKAGGSETVLLARETARSGAGGGVGDSNRERDRVAAESGQDLRGRDPEPSHKAGPRYRGGKRGGTRRGGLRVNAAGKAGVAAEDPGEAHTGKGTSAPEG